MKSPVSPAKGQAWPIASPAFLHNPYPFYRIRRERGPVVAMPTGPVSVTGFPEAQAILQDGRFVHHRYEVKVRDRNGGESFVDRSAPSEEMLRRWMLFTNPPLHGRLRSPLNPAFVPRMILDLEARVEEVVDRLLDAASAKGDRFEVVEDIGFPLPIMMIADLLGLPLKDWREFRKWTAPLARMLEPFPLTAEAVRQADQAAVALAAYLGDRIRDGGEGLLARLCQPDGEAALSQEEIAANAAFVLWAGHETTVGLISNGIHALLTHPGELDRLRSDPSLARNAVEELLRFDAPVQMIDRTATEDAEIGGYFIRKDQRAFIVIGAANRDPRVFEDPDRLDLGRTDINHLSFGSGIHHCLGAHLARLEVRVLLTRLLERFPDVRLDGDRFPRKPSLTLRAFASLPVRV